MDWWMWLVVVALVLVVLVGVAVAVQAHRRRGGVIASRRAPRSARGKGGS